MTRSSWVTLMHWYFCTCRVKNSNECSRTISIKVFYISLLATLMWLCIKQLFWSSFFHAMSVFETDNNWFVWKSRDKKQRQHSEPQWQNFSFSSKTLEDAQLSAKYQCAGIVARWNNNNQQRQKFESWKQRTWFYPV